MEQEQGISIEPRRRQLEARSDPVWTRRHGRVTKRILVPTDFSLCSAQALGQAVELAHGWQASITLLHVVDLNLHTPATGPANPQKLKEELWKEGLENLGQTILGLADQQVDAQSLIREGLPWKEIVEAAQAHDLIVMGRHRPEPFWSLFRRRTVKGVLEAASCPVLVVRERKEGKAR